MSDEYIAQQMLESIRNHAETTRKVEGYDAMVLENQQLKEQVRCVTEAHKGASDAFAKAMRFIHGLPGKKGGLEAAWLAGNMHAKGVLMKDETQTSVARQAYRGLVEISLKIGQQYEGN
jgi:hypothetical protein